MEVVSGRASSQHHFIVMAIKAKFAEISALRIR
jgi:hypothetical protein